MGIVLILTNQIGKFLLYMFYQINILIVAYVHKLVYEFKYEHLDVVQLY